MPNQSNSTRFLWIILGGGAIFLIAAVAGVAILLVNPAPTANPVVIAVSTDPVDALPTPTEAAFTAADDPMPPPTPLPLPADTPVPTGTHGAGAAAAGDTLALPSATPIPLPSPTRTPIPTDTPSSASALPAAQVEGLRVGNVAPDFTLGSNLASRVSLSDLRGKIVILNFWATWCPPCRREVPELQAIHNELGPQGVVVLAVNEGEKLENVERFAHNYNISFAVWLDEDKWAGSIYHVRSIPTTYFIDKEGIIRSVQIGTMKRDKILAHLDKLM